MEQSPSAVPKSPQFNQQTFHLLQTQECLLLFSQGIVLISVLNWEDRHVDGFKNLLHFSGVRHLTAAHVLNLRHLVAAKITCY